ncbi:D-alanyl-D-alanine carboxypeptidase/D-alanyl-D-alanine-endopeptidase [Nocardioides sp. MAH-18]|uniref:D-alanyl-D-alanine carboxypeptidase/D-alanyl-D-alanine-endopeptidase n=1 Tax=Nocardioides agri TaxID=2682843 RepID=A0A6L6XT58_9ACTN|nr:D-alanyl-D-alanine carboxypeptidase/D-alanyl-D-alanine-endopeptidase [Nocardioides sp. CGMCC 1.13656]MBA2955540.1 D-alanyl-D-alanine carboxypeptidase/D-alanyl-D-alanine-endopeptidase [Nocardioides sp. CGMCC 1.13656]MVQ50390.1 D-alanyl-D-alanine carboxypeptidase/D-alanyl-D-alanine-endopeptidase [Nocardioides sp. MAH-18]
MGRRDARHGSRLAFWLPVLLVLALLGGAGTAYWLDLDRADPDEEPAAVAPPAGLDLPPLTEPAPVALAAAGTADPARVGRVVARLLDDADLGPHVLATVAGLDGSVLYAEGDGTAVPASTLKLVTAAAALHTMPADQTFATTVVTDGPGRVVLVGGGDPLLASTRPDRDAYPRPADVVTLARATARSLQASGTTEVRVGYDASLFTGPDVSPHWPDSYVPDGVVAPIESLWVDEGRPASGFGRVADPARAAATAYAAELAKAGIAVRGEPRQRRADPAGTELARVVSPPLWQLVEHTLLHSDNEAAEVLARQVAVATGAPATFAGGADAVLDALAALGVPTQGAELYDGSGLSRDNRIAPETLTALLVAAASTQDAELRPVLTGLPVAGFTGSLTERFAGGTVDRVGRGAVRAKTGTLTGVTGLAGTVVDRTGTPMVFALLTDDVALLDTLDARAALDDVASALAACRCGTGAG